MYSTWLLVMVIHYYCYFGFRSVDFKFYEYLCSNTIFIVFPSFCLSFFSVCLAWRAMIHDCSSKNSTRKGFFFWSSLWWIGNETKTCFRVILFFFFYFCSLVIIFSGLDTKFVWLFSNIRETLSRFCSYLYPSFSINTIISTSVCVLIGAYTITDRICWLRCSFQPLKLLSIFCLGSIWFCHSSSIRFSL